MSYLKTIEFLVKEVAKKDQEIKSLSIALDSKAGLSKDLEALSDKRLENLVAVKDELEEMTIEKDHWKAEALDYRDKEKQWWAEEEKLKSSIVSTNQDRIKVVGELEDKIKILNDEVSKFKADYLAEADYVIEKEEEIGRLNERIQELEKFKDKHKDSWATEFAYHHLKKAYDDNNSYYEERIAKLQVELNHLKHNK